VVSVRGVRSLREICVCQSLSPGQCRALRCLVRDLIAFHDCRGLSQIGRPISAIEDLAHSPERSPEANVGRSTAARGSTSVQADWCSGRRGETRVGVSEPHIEIPSERGGRGLGERANAAGPRSAADSLLSAAKGTLEMIAAVASLVA
jgi:hypothetical protein